MVRAKGAMRQLVLIGQRRPGRGGRSTALTIAIRFLLVVVSATVLALPASAQSAPPQQALGSLALSVSEPAKWRRTVVSLTNTTYSSNPFELEVGATFTHGASGTTVTLPGYYAGGDTWKLGFMPTETGDWTYTTSSTDSDLNGVTGSLSVIDSGLPGFLSADPAHPKKWKFSDGDYVVPIALRTFFNAEPATVAEFEAAADYMAANNIHQMQTQLTEEYGMWENGRHDYIFEGDWTDHLFDLVNWDRLEERMEALTERGLGARIMFYSDAPGEPGWGGQSATEELVIRYAVARLSGYPVLFWNTGIAVFEYRSQADIDWMGNQLDALDPYDHPRSSRDKNMASENFQSEDSPLGSDIARMLQNFNDNTQPTSHDDAWGENRDGRIKDNTEDGIRRAIWKSVIAGGTGAILRGGGDGTSEDGHFRIHTLESDWESEQWITLINPFVNTRLGSTFGEMIPDTSIVSNGYAIADPAKTKLLYLLIGENDKFDMGGGAITVKVSSLTGSYTATWYDTRSGVETSAGTLPGGFDHVLTPPSTDDWVLLLSSAPTDGTAPTSPSGVTATGSFTDIALSWSAASDAESGISLYKVYRDGAVVGTPSGTSFNDTGVVSGPTYSYEVSAVNGVGLEGPKAGPVAAVMLTDGTATVGARGPCGNVCDTIGDQPELGCFYRR